MRLVPGHIWIIAWLVFGGWFGKQTAHGQVNSRFSGYLEHQYSLSYANDSWRHVDYDRFRADLDVRAGRGSRGSVGVIYQIYRGDTRLTSSDFLPDGIQFPQDSVLAELGTRNYLNHAYMALGGRMIEATAGKQYLNWGAAWVFNPTELFRPKNSLEPAYDREGVGAISVRFTLGPMSDLQAALIPNGKIEDSGRVLRLRHHVSGFDVSAMVATKTDGQSLFDPEPGKRRLILGGDITGEVLGLGWWAEGICSERGEEQWAEVTLGGNYSFVGGTLILMEVFVNGRGDSDGVYSAQAWLEKLSGEKRTLGRTTIVGMVNHKVGQLWTVGISAIANPDDRSAVLIPAVSYSFAENVDLLLNGIVYVGDPGDEYGADQIGAFIRGRIYF